MRCNSQSPGYGHQARGVNCQMIPFTVRIIAIIGFLFILFQILSLQSGHTIRLTIVCLIIPSIAGLIARSWLYRKLVQEPQITGFLHAAAVAILVTICALFPVAFLSNSYLLPDESGEVNPLAGKLPVSTNHLANHIYSSVLYLLRLLRLPPLICVLSRATSLLCLFCSTSRSCLQR